MKAVGPIPSGFAVDKRGCLAMGGRPVDALVDEAGGTPLFVYDQAMIEAQVRLFRASMPARVNLHYAVKANPYPLLLSFLHKLVDGFDLASVGELRALEEAVGLDRPVSFAGPGKRDEELETAVRSGVTINVESEGEAHRLMTLSDAIGIRPRAAVRVNPPFALKGAGMKMGGLASPFGVDNERAAPLVRYLVEAGADWRGLHVYAGSQCLSAEALIEAQASTLDLAIKISMEAGHAPPELNLGGGFGIPYFAGDKLLDVAAIGAALDKALADADEILADTQIALELGRWLVGEAGVYLTRVVDRKVSHGRTYVVTDGGLQHMLAASGNFGQLLRRNYPVANASLFASTDTEELTVTGCLCTPLDLLADEAELAETKVGDLIAVFCAGAYGLTASPQAFLSQPVAREVLV